MSIGSVFIAHGDMTQLTADALVYSTSVSPRDTSRGDLYSAFEKHLTGFDAKFQAARQEWARGRRFFDPGEAFWVPLSVGTRQKAARPHGLVLVAVGGETWEGEPEVEAAVANAVDEATRQLEDLFPAEDYPEKRFLIALPAFRLGTGGSRGTPLASARRLIQAALDALRNRPRVDVVFVIYPPDLYRIFLEAHTEIKRGATTDAPEYGDVSAAGPLVPPKLEKAVRGGECVLFVGAGLSVPAGIPSYGDLMKAMARQLGDKAIQKQVRRGDLNTYLDLAQWYRENHKDRLPGLVRRMFAVDPKSVKPTLAHYLLLDLPFRYVVTTNYDDLIERTLTALRRLPIKVVDKADVPTTGARDGTYVVKFHGDAHTPIGDGNAPGNDIIVSRDDYDHFFTKRPVMAALLEGLMLNQTFLFIGYSLRDPNFRQIVSRIDQMLEDAKRDAYAVTFDPVNDYYRAQCERKGLHLIEISGRTYAKKAECLQRFLQELAVGVTGGQRPFLSRDATPSSVETARFGGKGDAPRLDSVEAGLFELGGYIERAHSRATPDEARRMAAVLTFLTENGWRPKTIPRLSDLWERLASRLMPDDPSGPLTEEQRQMLVVALSRTERFGDAERLRSRLGLGTESPPRA